MKNKFCKMKRLSIHKGKRSIKRKTNKKKILILTVCVVILIVVFFKTIGVKDNNVENYIAPVVTNSLENTSNNSNITEENPVPEVEIVDVSHLPNKMGRFDVIGELVIDKIGVKNNILLTSQEDIYDGLKLSVTKFYGPDINEVGNFCITGHNYKNSLKRLYELEVGDTFYLINKQTGTKVNYQVYNMYTCYPNQVECIDQPTEMVKEVTLITCNPGGATRLICKAKEI